jgi:hypothetical protein
MKFLPFIFAVFVYILFSSNILGDDNNGKPIKHLDVMENLNKFEKDFPERVKKYLEGYKNKTIYQEEIEIDVVLELFKTQRSNLKKSSSLFFIERPSGDLRKTLSIQWLIYCREMSKFVNLSFDFSKVPFLNMAPNGNYRAGIAPKNIKEPEIRKDYEERLAKNAEYAREFRLQHTLHYLIPKSLEESREFIIKSYSQSPRANEEIVELLEKYEYPEEEKVKVFKALNIPYKGFREWQTNDGLLTLTAKVISVDKKEIKLEKEDGKQFTIELSALRKEDQDYVKRQLESETKTPQITEDEKTKN